jgi:small-conductance mechanosensitive channel
MLIGSLLPNRWIAELAMLSGGTAPPEPAPSMWDWFQGLAIYDWIKFASNDQRLLGSIVLAVLILVAYKITARAIRRTHWPTPEARKRWVVLTRNAALLLLLVSLAVIWAQTLQQIALSIAAFALALVIALKELLLCVSGELYRSSARLYRVGSRIEVNGLRGDVIDTTLLTTTIMEIGTQYSGHQYTGRAIVLPNSTMLTSPVYNESFTRHYVLHTFVVPVSLTRAWQQAERALLQAAEEASEEYLEDARRHIERIGQREGLDTPAVDPRVSLRIAEPERIELSVRVPVPARRKGQIEQAIVRRFLELHPPQAKQDDASTPGANTQSTGQAAPPAEARESVESGYAPLTY